MNSYTTTLDLAGEAGRSKSTAPAGCPIGCLALYPRRRTLMAVPERDTMIIKLHRAGWSCRRIAKAVGMRSPGSVSRALEGILEGRPGRDARA